MDRRAFLRVAGGTVAGAATTASALDLTSLPAAARAATAAPAAAIRSGPAEPRRSYLNQPAVVSAALVTGCDAVPPGYGFLSEDAGFAEVCAAHDLHFIGPRAEILERFESKYAVRRMLAANGLPTVPGSRGIVRDLRDALDQAAEAG